MFLTPGGIFFTGVTPPRGGGGYGKRWVLQKKLFLPMSHVAHIITAFPPHNMSLRWHSSVWLFGVLAHVQHGICNMKPSVAPSPWHASQHNGTNQQTTCIADTGCIYV